MNQQEKRTRFHSFLNEHIGIIQKLCRGYTNTEEDFKDNVQEVCYQLWKSIDHFQGKSKSGTWVYKLTLNVCLYNLKKRKRNPLVATENSHLNRAADRVSKHEGGERPEETLYRAITLLKPIDRAIIMLYLDKKEHAEIAEIVGLSVSNVGVKINRIKKQLQKIVHEGATKDLG